MSFIYFPFWLSGECKKFASFSGFSVAVTPGLSLTYPP